LLAKMHGRLAAPVIRIPERRTPHDGLTGFP
jgi:hypothetical protein